MKIAFISAHSFSYPGGVQEHIIYLKKEFEKKRHRVKIIAPQSRIWSSEVKEEDFIFLGKPFDTSFIGTKITLSSFLNFLNKGNIIKMLSEESFDLLHFQNFGVFLPYFMLNMNKSLNLPCILTLHAFFKNSFLYKFSPLLNKFIFKKFDGIICTSKPVLSQLKYSGPVEVIPNGVDIEFWGQKKQATGDRRQATGDRLPVDSCKLPVNILFVGRLEKRKGLIYLIRAFEILKKMHKYLRLTVVGEGKERKLVEDYIKYNHIQDIFLKGEIGKNGLLLEYQNADICCFPSIYGEGFGMVLLEAMAEGKPVVAFANEGYKEVLTSKGEEFLAIPKNIEDLAKKLEILIRDKKIREEMGRWGREKAKRYGWGEIAEKTLKFYEKVIK